MGRLMAIDYGRKRCGIAVTDTLRIVATALATVETSRLVGYVKDYVTANDVDRIIVGLPTTMKGEPSESMRYITPALGRLHKELPGMEIEMWDERFTSTLAHRAMIEGGFSRSTRRDKGAIDRMAAVIILNSYLDSHHQ
ncbi:MAG: Holliday junction resolvase RuvX [Duncaniella sp.]|nr:Holliday junction resolvase RuvX [Duncaniella sp.]